MKEEDICFMYLYSSRGILGTVYPLGAICVSSVCRLRFGKGGKKRLVTGVASDRNKPKPIVMRVRVNNRYR